MNTVPTILYLGKDPEQHIEVVTYKEQAAPPERGWRVVVSNRGVDFKKTDENGEILDLFTVPFERADQVHEILSRNL